MGKPKMLLMLALIAIAVGMGPVAGLAASTCVDCHKSITPNIVSDWEISKHAQAGMDCSICHGSKHNSPSNVAEVQIPTPETCAACHAAQVEQFKAGKHSMAWAAMKAMPTMHYQPSILIEGMKGCGGCHKIGVKNEEELKILKKNTPGFGVASCDACHTRHTFSTLEARQPQACETCHMGFDHPQWEMFSSSKHGVRYLLKQNKILPEQTSAPTCQTCHMQEGNHEVRTAWGFLAVRLPMPDDLIWKEDRTTILKALGVMDPAGQPAARMDIFRSAQVARFTQEGWQKERDKMTATCKQCHAPNFVKSEMSKSDNMIREADHVMAEAIRIVAGLYQDGTLKKPENYAYAYPDLLAFHDSPTPIEQKLFVMFLEHRNRSFQGAFHNSPDYSLWYGWSEMQRDLTDIKWMAQELRADRKAQAK